jgi:hypothetical protein
MLFEGWKELRTICVMLRGRNKNIYNDDDF